jgi:anti-sigma B factor antagonist
MGYSASGTAASEAGPARQQQPPGTVRLADMLTLSCRLSQTGQATVTFAGELDAASADQACQYVRDVIDAHGGQVLLDMAGLSFCDARGLGALVRMSRHAGQAGASLHLVAPPPRLMKIIRITSLGDNLPVRRKEAGATASSVSQSVPLVTYAYGQPRPPFGIAGRSRRRSGWHNCSAMCPAPAQLLIDQSCATPHGVAGE